MQGFRWLTVSPPGQEDVSIVLMAIPGPPMFEPETVSQINELMGKGCAGTVFLNTDDCQALFDRCVAAGCEVESAPARLDRWPVTVAFVKDPDGYLLELIEYHEDTPAGVINPKSVNR